MPTHPPAARRRPTPRTLARLLLGLFLFGMGIAFMVAADLGLGPWDVLHQGISRLTGIPLGTVGIGVGLVLLVAFPLLGERLGVGTVLNVLVIGLVIDLFGLVLDVPSAPALRLALLASGIVSIAVGSGFYIGAGLGPGPRDGIMTGLARRGIDVGLVRAGIELTVLVLGVVLGGTAGVGTVAFAVAIGPLVRWALPRFSLPEVELGAGAPPDPATAVA